MLDIGFMAPAAGIITTVIMVLGLILGIVLLFVFLPAKNKTRYRGAAKWLYDFLNFNQFWLSSIIKVLFIAAATACLLGGFITLFIQPLAGLTLMLSTVVVRLIYELIMLLLSIRENTAQINDAAQHIARQMGAPVSSPVPPAAPSMPAQAPPMPQSTPVQAPPAEPVAPAQPVCPNCGSVNAPGSAFCISCGTKL